MQEGVQTDATCNIQQGWELLVNNVAPVCTQPKCTRIRVRAVVRVKNAVSKVSGFAGTGRWLKQNKNNNDQQSAFLSESLLLEPYSYICQWDEKSTHSRYKNKQSTLELV